MYACTSWRSGLHDLVTATRLLAPAVTARHGLFSNIVINEGDRAPSPPSSRLIKPKTESALLPMKKEHEAMAAADETALKWAKADYVRE